jgi:hypothetical protein
MTAIDWVKEKLFLKPENLASQSKAQSRDFDRVGKTIA